jgi:4a-hydroxytetrahydrobiopterin dehydratase
MEREKMTGTEIEERIKATDGWRLDGGTLFRRFEFQDFAESLAFVNRVSEIAETANHHPDITFGWGYAELRTMTHDRGGVTDVDFALVEKIDEISQPSV